MENDILPSGQQDTKPNSRQPMPGQRLRGHSLDIARQRLSGDKEEVLAAKEDVPNIAIDNDGSPTQAKRRFWHRWHDWSRRRKIITVIIALLVLAGIGVALLAIFDHHKPVILQKITFQTKKVPPKPTSVASPLTGVQTAPSLAARPVTGIMIENSTDARPQSGLQDAGVVYEAIAEGGITRFLALFQDTAPQYIGPVRSLRPYYIDFAAPFQASIVHVGGSPDALSEVENGNYRNLDQFFNGSYFTRITARAAPHNVYTSFTELDALNKSKGYTSSKFTSWPRKADKKLAVPTAKSINFSISSPVFSAHYDYNPATNSYLRSEGGAPHMELLTSTDKTGVQISPKVVIALVMNYSIIDKSGHSDYGDTGSGTAYIFQDGGVTQGSWNKANTTDQFTFKDSAGNQIKLNAGQTWISLVNAASDVSYSP